MATWSSGAVYSSGTLWGPVSPLPPATNTPNHPPKHRAMQRQDFFPTLVGLRAAFFAKLANGLPEANLILGMPALDVANIIKDCRFCEYASGDWISAARKVGPACTASLEELYNGTGVAPMVLAVFTPPPLPAGNPAAVPPLPAVVPVRIRRGFFWPQSPLVSIFMTSIVPPCHPYRSSPKNSRPR